METDHVGAAKPRARRTAPEVIAKRVLEVAKERIVAEGGLTLGFEHLPLESYIKDSGVPRSSVYRKWASHEYFVADLIQHLFEAEDFTQGFDPSTRHAIEAVVREHVSLLAGTPEERRALMHEMVRVGVAANMRATASSQFRRSYWTLASAIGSIAPSAARASAVATVTRIEATFISSMASFYETLIGLIQMRLRPSFTARHIAVLTNTVVDGFIRRVELDRAVVETTFSAPGLDGELVDWTFAAWSIASAIDGMTEGYGPPPALEE